ncbi:MAG: PQQ-dependent sugar dehydrogenase, partial [Anaerolineae bacterium]
MATAPATPGPAATADAAGQRITLPAGFRINIYADGLSEPRFMTFSADGALYVSEMGAGRISRLVDVNGAGLADEPTVVADGLSTPHGLEWNGDWLYVAELGRVDRLRDADGDGILETRELVTDNIPGAGGHSTRTLHFGPDGM